MFGVLRRLARRLVGFLRTRPPATAGEASAETRAADIVVPAADRRPLRARLLALRTRLFTLVATAGVVAFGALAWLVRAGSTAEADLALTQGVQAVEHPLAATLMTAVSQPGFPPLSLWLVLGTTGALWLAGQPLAAGLALAAGGGALVGGAFKLLLQRSRPDADVVRVSSELLDYSFPSGHTLLYVGFFGFLFYLAYTHLRRGPVRTTALVVLGALILLVGPSRVYLGHHWPSDVLASYALGLAYLVLLVRFYARQAVPRAA